MTFYMIRITVSTNLCYRAGGDSTELTVYWGMNDYSDDNNDDSDDADDCMIVIVIMKITDLCANYQLMVS